MKYTEQQRHKIDAYKEIGGNVGALCAISGSLIHAFYKEFDPLSYIFLTIGSYYLGRFTGDCIGSLKVSTEILNSENSYNDIILTGENTAIEIG